MIVIFFNFLFRIHLDLPVPSGGTGVLEGSRTGWRTWRLRTETRRRGTDTGRRRTPRIMTDPADLILETPESPKNLVDPKVISNYFFKGISDCCYFHNYAQEHLVIGKQILVLRRMKRLVNFMVTMKRSPRTHQNSPECKISVDISGMMSRRTRSSSAMPQDQSLKRNLRVLR